MKNVALLFSALLLCYAAVATATENTCLHGRVVDTEGNPVEGVAVYTDYLPTSTNTTTDANGYYQFTTCTSINTSRPYSIRTEPVFSGNTVSFSGAAHNAKVSLELFDLAGKCVSHVKGTVSANQGLSIDIPTRNLAPSAYVLRVTVANNSFTRKAFVNENGALQVTGGVARASMSNAVAAADGAIDIIDNIHFYHDKYLQKDSGLTTYHAEINVEMEAKDTLPPVITFEGDDTLTFAFQDSTTWRQSLYEGVIYSDNSGVVIPQPSTNTLIRTDSSSFVCISYFAVDPENLLGTASRIFILYDSTIHDDLTPPEITMENDTVQLTTGDLFFPKNDLLIADAVDFHIHFIDWVKITDNIETVTGRFPPHIVMDVPGTYKVTYEVVDTHRNYNSKERVVIVSDAAPAE